MASIKTIIKLFEQGNVCVVGERGKGKDMLFANVIARRNLPYVSNCRYDKKGGLAVDYFPLEFDKIDCGQNTYVNFINGTINYYEYPYPMGADVYITDVGVYLPSQYCNELNKAYKYIPTFMALSRQLGQVNTHINTQSLNRCWDKLREQSRTYITALGCKVIPIGKHQLVLQKVRIHERYESCLSNVPKLNLPWWIYISADKMLASLYKLNYRIQHGDIKEYTLIYWNKSDYDTNIFRTILKGGITNGKSHK